MGLKQWEEIMMGRVAVIVLLTLYVSDAKAFEVGGQMISYSQLSCGRFAQVADDEHAARTQGKVIDAHAIATEAYALELGWAAGYLTAVNEYFPGEINTDMASAMLFVENYCRENPLSNFGAGLSELVYEIDPSVRKRARGE